MSQKERPRLGVMKQVKAKLVSLVVAAQLLGLSYRQAKRVWCRYRERGDAGLVHLGRGRVGNRSKQGKVRERVLARYQERYPDFGPTLAAEHLSREGLKVDHETLRRWLLAEGRCVGGRQHQAHESEDTELICFQHLILLVLVHVLANPGIAKIEEEDGNEDEGASKTSCSNRTGNPVIDGRVELEAALGGTSSDGIRLAPGTKSGKRRHGTN